MKSKEFPESARCAEFVFYNNYSRLRDCGKAEGWLDVCNRAVDGIDSLCGLSALQKEALYSSMRDFQCLPSGRWLRVGGTEWIKNNQNYYGAYNCASLVIDSWGKVVLCLELALSGCGVGILLTPENLAKIESPKREIVLNVASSPGELYGAKFVEETSVEAFPEENGYKLIVGDSRKGWCDALSHLFSLASIESEDSLQVELCLGYVRPEGTPIAGFGGVANPKYLADFFRSTIKILNSSKGNSISLEDCSLLCDEIFTLILSAGVRKSASLHLIPKDSSYLRSVGEIVAPKLSGAAHPPLVECLKPSHHTVLFQKKPTLRECEISVQHQFRTGGGTLLWAGEALARANRDILKSEKEKQDFLCSYESGEDHLKETLGTKATSLGHRLSRYGINPCGEIVGSNFLCNLSEIHLNMIAPMDFKMQLNAFKCGAIWCASHLKHVFKDPMLQESREIDPIVGVSFTGLFDFFVALFGKAWLVWWKEGRSDSFRYHLDACRRSQFNDIIKKSAVSKYISTEVRANWDGALTAKVIAAIEVAYLKWWKSIVKEEVMEFCTANRIKKPNRYTTVQPAGVKSLLTGACQGWQPPLSPWYIRRISVPKGHSLGELFQHKGYKVCPGYGSCDSDGRVVEDLAHPNCVDWLVEFPCYVPWAEKAKAVGVNFQELSAIAQFKFYMQVQRYYSMHNTSGTIRLGAGEVKGIANAIHSSIKNDEGYVSVALFSKDNQGCDNKLPIQPVSESYYTNCIQEICT